MARETTLTTEWNPISPGDLLLYRPILCLQSALSPESGWVLVRIVGRAERRGASEREILDCEVLGRFWTKEEGMLYAESLGLEITVECRTEIHTSLMLALKGYETRRFE